MQGIAKGDVPERACRPTQLQKVSSMDVVERLDNGPAQLLDPTSSPAFPNDEVRWFS